MIHHAVNFGAEVMVFLKELELTRGVSAEGSGGWEWGSLEGLNVLMWIPIDHTIDKGVLAVFELDILGGLHFAAGADVEGDVVCTFI